MAGPCFLATSKAPFPRPCDGVNTSFQAEEQGEAGREREMKVPGANCPSNGSSVMRPRCGAGALSINIEPGKSRCRCRGPSTLPLLWRLVGSLGRRTGELPTTAEQKSLNHGRWSLDSGWGREEP